MKRRACLALLAAAFTLPALEAWADEAWADEARADEARADEARADEARAETPAEPDGYRLDKYKAPTPRSLRGATVVGTAAAHDLWQARGIVFVDVLPHPPKPADLPAGTLWRDPPHETIGGAVWLPNVGQGALAATTEDYFRRNLAELTGGDRDKPLLFFCRRDCWMSWNAAKRALGYGYRHIYWYSDGVDGWKAGALPMQTVQPRP